MQRWEERVLDLEKGRTEGRKSAEICIIRNQLNTKKKNADEISDILGLAPDYVTRIVNLLRAYPDETDGQIAARILQTQS